MPHICIDIIISRKDNDQLFGTIVPVMKNVGAEDAKKRFEMEKLIPMF